MIDKICPICGKDLVEIELDECWFLVCCNSKCRCKGVASDTVWEYLTVAIKNRKALSQELIRTGKALEIAITGLKNCKTRDHIGAVCRTPEYVDKILGQINTITKGCEK